MQQSDRPAAASCDPAERPRALADKVRSQVEPLTEEALPKDRAPDEGSRLSGEAEAGTSGPSTTDASEGGASGSADPEAQERPTLRAAGRWSNEQEARMVALTRGLFPDDWIMGETILVGVHATDAGAELRVPTGKETRRVSKP